ncbi:hypothetical protein [Clostridium sp.]|uniref:hypothetical protein n=1 Tax=Clostridium sp. TaxID=1506 RepID=UPI003217CE78
MCDNKCVSIFIENAMETLQKVGIHSIYVKSKEEARNFIMYHINIGTVVKLDSSLQALDLRLEKSIIEKGGNIVNDYSDNIIVDELHYRKSSIAELYLCGGSYMFSKDSMILSSSLNNNCFGINNKGKKIIVAIHTNSNSIENKSNKYIFKEIARIEKMVTNKKGTINKACKGTEESNENNFLRQKNTNNDISVVFIE